MKLRISKEGSRFEVEDPTLPGSPPIGHGKTMMEAIGSFFHSNQTRLGIDFDVHETAVPAEMRRRRRELRRR